MEVRVRQSLLDPGTVLVVALLAGVAAVGGTLSPGLRELHRTWWFRALLAWGCIALTVCGLRTLAELCARARGGGIRGHRPPGKVLVAGLQGLTAERVSDGFRTFGYRVGRWDATGDRVVEGVKGWVGWLGRGLLHCGLGAVLLGGGVGELLGRSQTHAVREGGGFTTRSGPEGRVVVADSACWVPTAGKVRLRAVAASEEGPDEARWLEAGDAWRLSGREVRVLSIGPSASRFRTASVKVEHADGWEQVLELRAGVPAALRGSDSVTATSYVALDAPTRSPAGPALHVEISSGDSLSGIWVTPWEGTGVAGPYGLTLVGVIPEAQATLAVRSAPGDPFVASGLLAFALGVACSAACPLRRVWALITPLGDAALGAHGPFASRLWREEVGRLAGVLARESCGAKRE